SKALATAADSYLSRPRDPAVLSFVLRRLGFHRPRPFYRTSTDSRQYRVSPKPQWVAAQTLGAICEQYLRKHVALSVQMRPCFESCLRNEPSPPDFPEA